MVGVRGKSGRPMLFAVAALACMALLGPSGAGAATVVNGDFESGTLNGWSVHRATLGGNWFAYRGSSEPIAEQRGKPVVPPPQGAYAAIADEISPETLILSQNVVLEPGLDHRLSLLAYYESKVPIAVPAPDTLSVNGETLAGQANQQYRIDVMKPGAAIESVDPADVLRTVFRTVPGRPKKMLPTTFTADLTPFAGQTVRLRMAVAAHEELLNAGVDAVSILSARPGQLPGASGRMRLGKAKANRSNGTATLPVSVPGAGLLKAKGKGVPVPAPNAGVSKVRKRSPIKPASVRAARAGTVKLLLKPTPTALQILREKHKLRVQVTVTFKPAGRALQKATVPVVLKLAPRPSSRH